MFTVNSKLIGTDITCIKFTKPYILVGVGGYLHVFCNKTFTLTNKVKVFDGQKIYGIILNTASTKLLVYGGLKISVFEFPTFTELTSTSLQEWVLCAKWIDNDSKIALVSMHNKFSIWSLDLKLEREIVCEERCISYSAFICNESFDEAVILSGTVFNEILIWIPSQVDENNLSIVLKRLKQHKGVIFSIDYNEKSGHICSSSDDRSAILWQIRSKNILSELKNDPIDISCKAHVYGHLSRIFKCKVLNHSFLTAGEDSIVNIWNYNGDLIRKVEANQGSSIWSLDYCEEYDLIAAGGGDSGLLLFNQNFDVRSESLILPNAEVPKSVAFLNNKNIVCITEAGILWYYVDKLKQWKEIQRHEELKSYNLLEVSPCRNLVALAGYSGQIFIYKTENDNLSTCCEFVTLRKTRIFSFHWLTSKTFLICENDGILTLYYLKNNIIEPITFFVLPKLKERWSTTACLVNKENLAVGDRRGNLHLFRIEEPYSVQTIKNVYNYITNLTCQNKKLVSLGRNGLIKTFSLDNDGIEMISSDKVPFMWLAKIVDELLLAFSGNNFIIWNYKTRSTLYEYNCGGGHRSWDLFKDATDVMFVYVKDKVIHIKHISYNSICTNNLIEGYHVNEINSLKSIRFGRNCFIISGGEDTTLRISQMHLDKSVFSNKISLKSHLSSIRTLVIHKISNREYLLFSAGGRAQIVCWKLEVGDSNKADVLCKEMYSHYERLENEISEIRIMDLEVKKFEAGIFLFVACSDGIIKVFSIENNTCKLSLVTDISYKLKCIMKISVFEILNEIILVTMATDGELVFWNISDLFKNNTYNNFNLNPVKEIKVHQSGINSYSHMLLNNISIILTGGDDNAINLTAVEFVKNNNTALEINLLHSIKDVGSHCAQITGTFITEKYFFTASIDQKLNIFEWTFYENKLNFKLLKQYSSAIADIQGLDYVDETNYNFIIYGNGIEYVQIDDRSEHDCFSK